MSDAAPARPMSSPVDSALDEAAEALRRASAVALAGHLNPDPDAIGSMLGLAGVLRTRGKDVVCSWANVPMELPRWLEAVPGHAPLVDSREFPKAPAVMVALDTASHDRLGSLSANADRAGTVIVLDHHQLSDPAPPAFALVNPLVRWHKSDSPTGFKPTCVLRTLLSGSGV